MLDRNKFLELITAMAEIYGKELPLIAIDIYYNVLKEYSYERVVKGFEEVVKTHKYNNFPVPAEILNCIPQWEPPKEKQIEYRPEFTPEQEAVRKKSVDDLRAKLGCNVIGRV
jgi:hypothetical protein